MPCARLRLLPVLLSAVVLGCGAGRAAAAADEVRATIPWRRHDADFRGKGVVVQDLATGATVVNALACNLGSGPIRPGSPATASLTRPGSSRAAAAARPG